MSMENDKNTVLIVEKLWQEMQFWHLKKGDLYIAGDLLTGDWKVFVRKSRKEREVVLFRTKDELKAKVIYSLLSKKIPPQAP